MLCTDSCRGRKAEQYTTLCTSGCRGRRKNTIQRYEPVIAEEEEQSTIRVQSYAPVVAEEGGQNALKRSHR
jgi:spore coat polysaccharide biosynthesis protein SpsF (cytidylyltransferase family)